MSCPTCGHTMHKLGNGAVDWCPRCGTSRDCLILPFVDAPIVPKLVERCREFQRQVCADKATAAFLEGQWHVLGIRESINLPEDRK